MVNRPCVRKDLSVISYTPLIYLNCFELFEIFNHKILNDLSYTFSTLEVNHSDKLMRNKYDEALK